MTSKLIFEDKVFLHRCLCSSSVIFCLQQCSVSCLKQMIQLVVVKHKNACVHASQSCTNVFPM